MVVAGAGGSLRILTVLGFILIDNQRLLNNFFAGIACIPYRNNFSFFTYHPTDRQPASANKYT